MRAQHEDITTTGDWMAIAARDLDRAIRHRNLAPSEISEDMRIWRRTQMRFWAVNWRYDQAVLTGRWREFDIRAHLTRLAPSSHSPPVAEEARQVSVS